MMRRLTLVAAGAAFLWAGAPAAAQAPAWNPEPWLQDLAQIRATLDTKYANREWLTGEREVNLDALFGRAQDLLRSAGSDAQATSLLNRIVAQIGDGHVALNWPAPTAPTPSGGGSKAGASPATAESLCQSIGYNGSSAGVVPAVAGYKALPDSDTLPAGTATIGGTTFGFLRIGLFMPQGSPKLCHAAVAALKIPLERPCDSECQDGIITHAYHALGAAMMDRLTRLKAAGAQVLVVDITGNGGGSEWTEAAARMLSRRPLQSAQMGFVRGTHWTANWQRVIDDLTKARASAKGAERRQIDGYIAEARRAHAEAARTCSGEADCPRLARFGYATGLVGKAPAGSFAGKDWAVHVFNAAQHNYRDGVWDGPVIVLTDGNTASAAEQFAAVLRDNGAAIILGSRTVGAGCGHTWGGTPTKLANSGATLTVPDCVRFRADGSNEVRGIIPDQLLPWRTNDGRSFRARLLEAALPETAAKARALYEAQR